MALFEGDLIGKFELTEGDKHAIVITDGNGNYAIVKAENSAPIEDADYWGILARGKDGHSPSVEINAVEHWVIDGVDTGHSSRGQAGSMANTQSLTGAVDLNAVTTAGFYELTSATVSNGPDKMNDQFTLFVYGGSLTTQILHGVGKNEVWIRGKTSSGTWSDWRMITQWNQ